VAIKFDDDTGEILEKIKGQDNLYSDQATRIKNIYSGMEKLLTCLIELD
jgi:hypothetical protein